MAVSVFELMGLYREKDLSPVDQFSSVRGRRCIDRPLPERVGIGNFWAGGADLSEHGVGQARRPPGPMRPMPSARTMPPSSSTRCY